MSASAPALAPVQPRVISPHSGESLPLVDVVRDLLAANSTGRAAVLGPPGCGKSTALEHLAADLLTDSRERRWQVLDGPRPQGQAPESLSGRLLIYEAHLAPHDRSVIPLPLCRWGRDEVIEYLLARHPAKCASIIARLPAHDPLDGSPLLWPRVLEELTDQPSLLDVDASLPASSELGQLSIKSDQHAVEQALERIIDREFREHLQTSRLIEAAHRFCTLAVLQEDNAAGALKVLKKAGCPHSTFQFLGQRAVRIHCAAKELADNLKKQGNNILDSPAGNG